jgi:DNA-binding MarR family transcriptional regulator
MVGRLGAGDKGPTALGVPAERVNVLFSVWLVSRSTADLLDHVLAPAGLSPDEFAIYSVLTATPAMTPTELARWMAAPPTTVSSYVKRLEARGHVERQPSAKDRRSYQVRLTEAGRRVHGRAAASFAPALDLVLEALGPRREDVLAALLDLRSALDEARIGRGPTLRGG